MSLPLPFCGPNQVPHYFYDIQPLLRQACANTATAGMTLYTFSALATLSHLLPSSSPPTAWAWWPLGGWLGSWEGEGPLHVCLPLPGHCHLLQHRDFTYVQPRGSADGTSGQVVSVCCTIIAYAQPRHLEPLQQGGEGGPAEEAPGQ